MPDKKPMVEVTCNGPYVVHNFSVIWNSNGKSIETQQTMALCRCGKSSNKPFCDGTHDSCGFRDDKN